VRRTFNGIEFTEAIYFERPGPLGTLISHPFP
jgi:hypothetical protein